MNFIPDTPVLFAFSLACIVLAVTPGPDMTLFVSRALSQGRAAGFMSMAGALTGSVVHTMMVAFGLSALIAASASAFFAVKIAGALYLVWLAVDTIRRGSALTVSREKTGRRSMSRVFMGGLLVNLLNPKIALFFLTFLPQFVKASDPDAAGKLVFLGLYFVAVSIPICGAMVIGADAFSSTLRRSPRTMRVFDWLFATVIGGFAVKLLFASRS